MANLQEKTEIKERFNLFLYKTIDFALKNGKWVIIG